MSKFFMYEDGSGLFSHSEAYEKSEFSASPSANAPALMDENGYINDLINLSVISHSSLADIGSNSHAAIDSHISSSGIHFSLIDDDTMATASASTAASSESIVAYVQSLLTSEMNIKGLFDASTPSPDLDTIDNYKGDFYKVSVAGTYLGLELNVGDMIILNKDVAAGTSITSADLWVVDNTEAVDILRSGDLSSAQIFVGNASNVATAVDVTGDVLISNSGVTSIQDGTITNSMFGESISDSSLAQDYIQTSEVDGQTIEFSGGSLSVVANGIGENEIDFGTGAGQVDGSSIPLADAGGYFATDNVEAALQEIGSKLDEENEQFTSAGVTLGDLVYVSAANTVDNFTLDLDKRPVGLARATVAAASPVSVADDCDFVSGLTVADGVIGDPVYWNGTGLTGSLAGIGAGRVWEVGVLVATGKIYQRLRYVKKNAA